MSHDAATRDLPDDLADLRRRYDSLPPPVVRWKTDVGRDFLNLLDQATDDYPVRLVAEALNTSTSAIYYMRWRMRRGQIEPWPTDEQLRDFRAAWRVVEARHARRQHVRRNSREFEQVHTSLERLSRTFSYSVLTMALGIKARQLKRFLDPPLNSPAELDELQTLIALYQQLPRRLRLGRRPVVITPEFTAAVQRAGQRVSAAKIARALDMDVTAIEHILGRSGRITS